MVQQPLSRHWADIAAHRIIRERGPERDRYVVASGITPSGQVHVGNFREVITVDLVARALQDLGKEVRFVYSWDDFDTFRKVPANLPDPKAYEGYLRQPIARIPDPWGQEGSYAGGREKAFEAELTHVGIFPEYLYQERKYSAGEYDAEIVRALDARETIREILNRSRTEPLASDWVPVAAYCRKCHRDDVHCAYPGEGRLDVSCRACGHEEKGVAVADHPDVKLMWRIDWPMRWAYEAVDFEPGGKDHSSEGGSAQTGAEIIQAVWGAKAPSYLQYDFVMIKGGTGKMSSSSGQLITLGATLKVYEPQILRWIFAQHRPNHDFALALDEDVIKVYDEFDRFEQLAYKPGDDKKAVQARRTYRFAQVDADGPMPEAPPKRAGFRVLCNRLQICGGDVERTFERFYAADWTGPRDREAFEARAKRAWHWLEHHAPEEFCYRLHAAPVKLPLDADEQAVLSRFRDLVRRTDLEAIDLKGLNELIWDDVIRPGACEAPQVFRVIYQSLIGRDQGPRLPGFLKEVGRDKLLELI